MAPFDPKNLNIWPTWQVNVRRRLLCYFSTNTLQHATCF
jgi:hypothetical protein